MTRVYAYARTSVDDGKKISIDAQLTTIKQKAFNEGLNVPIPFFDKDSSGATEQRPSFQKLKQRIAKGTQKGILYVWRYDRLARNTTLLLTFLDFCQKYQIQVVSIMEPLPKGSENSAATQKMFLQVLGVLGEMQRNVTIENINSTLAYKKGKQQYMGATVPIGYLLVEGQVKQDIAYVQLIRRVYELYITGNYGYKRVQSQLVLEGLFYKNQTLSINRIQAILSNPLYYGWIKGGHFGGYYGDFQPIVSKKVYDQVQAIKAQRRIIKKDQRIYPLRKKVRCPFCHWFLSPKKLGTNVASHSYYYYHCANRQCKGIMVSAKQLEWDVLEQLRVFLTNQRLFEALIKEMTSQLEEQQKFVKQKIVAHERERKNRIRDYEKGRISLDELKQYLKRVEQLNENTKDPQISAGKLQERLTKLLALQQKSVTDILWNQVKKVAVNRDKRLTEIYLSNLNENILSLNKGEES